MSSLPYRSCRSLSPSWPAEASSWSLQAQFNHCPATEGVQKLWSSLRCPPVPQQCGEQLRSQQVLNFCQPLYMSMWVYLTDPERAKRLIWLVKHWFNDALLLTAVFDYGVLLSCFKSTFARNPDYSIYQQFEVKWI